jgi:hypothetical protein
VANDFAGAASVDCPAGKVALGGGGNMQANMQINGPIMTGNIATGWTINSNGQAAGNITVWAICANVS